MKKFLSLVVAALLSVSAFATTASAKFADVDASNAALTDAVELLAAINVTKGVSETEFGTANNVTREQMAAFIYRMMKAGKSVEGGANNTAFVDLEDPTFFFMISWANSQGIIKGTSDTTFNPKGGITLQDAYTMIVRALGYDNGELAYPIGYISKAEELELDADLPATLGYTDTLTRGDLAIVLANMFYAETAETEIKYEASYKVICVNHNKPQTCTADGEHNYQAISNGQVPVEYRKTVAEKIFEVEEVSYRVVGTTNYKFEDADFTLGEDVEMITLVNNEDATDVKDMEFADLGLEGTSDDYFLSDLLVFEREDKNGDTEIFGATAVGTKTTVNFADVKFGTVSGTAADKYYDADKEFKMLNGKLTLGDSVTYLWNAPYSFDKGEGDLYPEFITLGDYTVRDIETEDEDYLDVNFSYEVVDYKVDNKFDESIVGWAEEAEMTDEEPATEWVNNFDGALSQAYFGGLGEIDVYDCDGDGIADYLFVKNYTVGTIETEEDVDLDAVDGDASSLIYTDLAIVEGVEAADKDVVVAYVNADANYVKVIEVVAGKEATLASSATKYFTLSTGEKVYYKGMEAVVANGAANFDTFDADDFTSEQVYYFTKDGRLVYVSGTASVINYNENYVIVLADEVTSTTSMVDGKLEKADYIEIYNNGEIKAVKVKKIEEGDKLDDEDTPFTFVDGEEGGYTFVEYVDKLATAKTDKNGAYYFNLVNLEINNDADALAALKTDDADAEYRKTGVEETYLNKKSGNLYVLDDVKESAKGVYIKDYTQIIIRSKDEDGNPVFTVYGAENLPALKEDTKFESVSYVLANNVNSKSYENLVVFYGVVDDELEADKGDLADIRIVKSYSKFSTEEGTVYTYDVLNPFTGEVETAIEGAATDLEAPFATLGDIVGLTSEGYIDDEAEEVAGNIYEAGVIYDTDDRFETYEDTLGYVTVAEYDVELGFLTIEDDETIYVINADTVVTFSDKSEESIKVVDAAVLASTAKTYRPNEDKNQAYTVFLCAEEDTDADDEDETFYNVAFVMIVRD